MEDIFGTVKPPVSTIPSDSKAALESLIALGIKVFIFIAAIALLIYLLLGAYEWIISGGDKDKLAKAQLKITNAVVGLLVIIVVLSVFCVITQNVLGWPSCFGFTLPQL